MKKKRAIYATIFGFLTLFLIKGGFLAEFVSPLCVRLWDNLWPRKVEAPQQSLAPRLPVTPPPPSTRTANPWQSTELEFELTEALGLTWDSPKVMGLLQPLKKETESYVLGDLWHYCFRESGIELAFDTSKQLHSILFQTRRRPGYRAFRFKGNLPGGVTLDMKRARVRDLLDDWGKSSSHGDTDCYAGSGHQLCIVYVADRDQYLDNDRILSMVLTMTEDHPRYRRSPITAERTDAPELPISEPPEADVSPYEDLTPVRSGVP